MNEDYIYNSIVNCSSVKETEDMIKKYFPEWLVCLFEDYSNDYPHLKLNWETICKNIGCTPQKIILVKDIKFENPPSLLNKICEYITRKGYVVRRYDEFISCENCGKAIPVYEIYKLMKNKGINVPLQWKKTCQNC